LIDRAIFDVFVGDLWKGGLRTSAGDRPIACVERTHFITSNLTCSAWRRGRHVSGRDEFVSRGCRWTIL